MKALITRSFTVAALALMVGFQTANAEGTMTGGGRPPFPPPSVVYVDSVCTVYSDNSINYADGSIVSQNATRTVFTDGITAYTSGGIVTKVVSSNGTVLSASN